MCCNLFHMLAIHLYEYVLTTLPRNISKVLNVFSFLYLVFARIQRYMWIFAEQKMPRKYFDEISLIHNTKSWQPCVPWGYRLYFCVSKPSSGRRLHESETDSRLTNGSCVMSLNSNHVVLNTMPNVFVDVGLPTVEV